MTALLEVKEKCKQIYANYGYAILPILKFLLAMAVFGGINATLNFSETANNIFLILIIALVCCVLPLGIMVFCGIGLIVLQCYCAGLEVAIMALALVLLLMIFYMRFTPDDSLILLLTPLAFMLQIPCVIPVSYGLIKKPVSAVSTSCGVIVYYFILLVQQKANILQATSSEDFGKNIQIIIDSMLNNSDLLVDMVAFIAVMLTVYLIRRLSVDYAWQIAIVTGSVMYIIIWVLAGLFMNVECLYVPLIIGTIISIMVVEIFAFFRYGVDYSRTEYHQFEDDDYYYYVKAIPKAKIAEKKVTVKKIHEKEPEVVVEEVKVYKTKSSNNNSAVVKDVVVQNPVTKENKDAFTKEKQEVAEQSDPEDAKEFKTESAKDTGKDSKTDIGDDGMADVDFQKKLEESLKNL